MRRFSQRSHLVTLSEINITPLLDLAFVLLIIFIITTPLLEKGLELKLPKASAAADQTVDKRDIRTVEVSPQGIYTLDKRRMTLPQIEYALRQAFAANPKTIVHIRADEMGFNKDLYAVIDACQRNGITRFSLRTAPNK